MIAKSLLRARRKSEPFGEGSCCPLACSSRSVAGDPGGLPGTFRGPSGHRLADGRRGALQGIPRVFDGIPVTLGRRTEGLL